MKTAVFTIVSKNYLAFARTLLKSVKNVHPDWEPYVLLVDEVGDEFDPNQEPFEVKLLSDINIPNLKKMLFRYTILELNTAVKPWMFYWLFNNKNYENVIYIDPDIYVYNKLTEVEKSLKNGKLMVMTPHLTGQLNDDKHPSELDVMRAGVYNLGFLAVSKKLETNTFLDWWKEKLEYDCVVDLERGLFVDQKWMDLAPSIFSDVEILRHSGYNVAYWNLNHRKVSLQDNEYYVNGQPLVFFHFSGVNPSNPRDFSKHQDRFNIKNIGVVSKLLRKYADDVLSNGHEIVKNYKYSYNKFSNGIQINEFCRRAYRNHDGFKIICGDNPFERPEVFIKEPFRKKDANKQLPLITYAMYEIWNNRQDLKNAFPDIFGNDRVAFCYWFIESAGREYSFDKIFIEEVKESVENFDRLASCEHNEIVEHEKASGINSANTNLQKGIYKAAIKAKPVMKKFISRDFKEKLKKVEQKLLRNAYLKTVNNPIVEQSTHVESAKKCTTYKQGVNIIGYAKAESGVGESIRNAAKALTAINMPFGIVNFETGLVSRTKDNTWEEKETNNFIYNTNIFHINADQTMVARNYINEENWGNRYNIGYWWWELPDFPDEWLDSFKVLDEVWVGSSFVRDAIAEKSPVPVVKIPPCIELNYNSSIKREYFNLPEKAFLFLTMYDVYSFQVRKNPQGAIESFKKTFGPNDLSVGLIIKINNGKSNPDEVKKLRHLSQEYKNIYIIDRTLTREEVNALISLTDASVSLHRSEGLGLLMAESMYLGKPTIGTNWSGNTDFMNHSNSCPVDYQLVNLGQDYGPYKAYQYWAEPDLDHASYYMNKLVQDPEFYKKIAYKGQQTLLSDYSPEKVGSMIEKRLKYLGLVNRY